MTRKSHLPQEAWARLAEAEVHSTLQALPAVLRDRLRDVPVLFESRPGPQLRNDGWPDDLLGLFEGPCHGERSTQDVSTQPPTITLFLENLCAQARDEPASFRQEVRTTLLHEIGHYLGLDEDGLLARDLE
ncbi:MAG: metallopeptidase family protein [Kiritimatiellia bacterium]